MLQPGTLLHGRYRIDKALQEGGMSVVYRAHDLSVDIVVAIKEMKDPFDDDDERRRAVQEFHKEAKILASLHHSGLPRVSHFFESNKSYYVVMDFIEGQTLDYEATRYQNQVPENICLSWAWQICAVLQYLHERHPPIIFRDLKPANIMVTSEGRIKLIDFGIAKIFEGEVRTHTLIRGAGTPGFAPPEQYGQMGRSHTDVRTDIYAVGATFYSLMQGVIPVEATTRFMHEEPLLPLTTASPAFHDIILRCLELAPERRYQTMEELIETLRPLVEGEPGAPVLGLPTQRPVRPSGSLPAPPPAMPSAPSTRELAPPPPPTVLPETAPAAPPPPFHSPESMNLVYGRMHQRSKPSLVRMWGPVIAILAGGVIIGSQMLPGSHPSPTPSGSATPTSPHTQSPSLTPSPTHEAVQTSAPPASVSAAPSAVAVAQTMLHVTGDPPWLQFVLDGSQPRVAGPDGMVVPVTAGHHVVKAFSNGYESREIAVDADAGRLTDVHVTLLAATLVRVTSAPGHMTVRVDGVVKGQTPLEIKSLLPGPHALMLSRSGYKTYKRRLDVRRGEVLVLDADVEKLPTPTSAPTVAEPHPVHVWTEPFRPSTAAPTHTHSPEGPRATPW